jgi:hypothetical protein
LLKMKCGPLSKASCCVAALAVLLSLWSLPDTLAQDQPSPAQGTSRGENFSAKPPAQLFASDCTGAGCHKGPQGLGRGQFSGSLASFLREHYTNSRESAAALAGYLSRLPSGPEPREARTPRSGKPTAAAPVPPANIPGWGEGTGLSEPRPAPNEARAPRQNPAGRTSRAAVRPDDEPGATPPAPPVAAPPVAEPTPNARAQRGRQPAATAAAPPPPPEPEAAPAPPPPKQYDIFD